jgi:hypothetical protein
MLISLCTFQEQILSQLSISELFVLGCPLIVMRVFVILSLLMNKNHGLCENSFLLTTLCCNVYGRHSYKPSQDFTRPLGMPRGLEGMLHMLNAIISPMTEDLCLLLSFYFWCCFAKRLANVKFGGV